MSQLSNNEWQEIVSKARSDCDKLLKSLSKDDVNKSNVREARSHIEDASRHRKNPNDEISSSYSLALACQILARRVAKSQPNDRRYYLSNAAKLFEISGDERDARQAKQDLLALGIPLPSQESTAASGPQNDGSAGKDDVSKSKWRHWPLIGSILVIIVSFFNPLAGVFLAVGTAFHAHGSNVNKQALEEAKEEADELRVEAESLRITLMGKISPVKMEELNAKLKALNQARKKKDIALIKQRSENLSVLLKELEELTKPVDAEAVVPLHPPENFGRVNQPVVALENALDKLPDLTPIIKTGTVGDWLTILDETKNDLNLSKYIDSDEKYYQDGYSNLLAAMYESGLNQDRLRPLFSTEKFSSRACEFLCQLRENRVVEYEIPDSDEGYAFEVFKILTKEYKPDPQASNQEPKKKMLVAEMSRSFQDSKGRTMSLVRELAYDKKALVKVTYRIQGQIEEAGLV
jgi:hypothetical protein